MLLETHCEILLWKLSLNVCFLRKLQHSKERSTVSHKNLQFSRKFNFYTILIKDIRICSFFFSNVYWNNIFPNCAVISVIWKFLFVPYCDYCTRSLLSDLVLPFILTGEKRIFLPRCLNYANKIFASENTCSRGKFEKPKLTIRQTPCAH